MLISSEIVRFQGFHKLELINILKDFYFLLIFLQDSLFVVIQNRFDIFGYILVAFLDIFGDDLYVFE